MLSGALEDLVLHKGAATAGASKSLAAGASKSLAAGALKSLPIVAGTTTKSSVMAGGGYLFGAGLGAGIFAGAAVVVAGMLVINYITSREAAAQEAARARPE